MPNNNWDTQRAEIAVLLSSWSGGVRKWIDRILDNEDHEVDKNKIINIITEWVNYLEDTKLKIIKMNSTPTKNDTEGAKAKNNNIKPSNH